MKKLYSNIFINKDKLSEGQIRQTNYDTEKRTDRNIAFHRKFYKN